MNLTPTGMSTSGEREAWAPTLTYRGVDLSGERVQMRIGPDPEIVRAYEAERALGLAHMWRGLNEMRRLVGMPGRHIEVNNPGAWDGRNSWEDLPAVGATPIWDAVVAEMGAPL